MHRQTNSGDLWLPPYCPTITSSETRRYETEGLETLEKRWAQQLNSDHVVKFQLYENKNRLTVDTKYLPPLTWFAGSQTTYARAAKIGTSLEARSIVKRQGLWFSVDVDGQISKGRQAVLRQPRVRRNGQLGVINGTSEDNTYLLLCLFDPET